MENKNDETILSAGAAISDITPPLEVGLLTSSVHGRWEPFQSIRLPLKARVLVLQFRSQLFALVSLDLLGLNSTAVGGWNDFKESLSDKIPPGQIIITCTHTHNAPESGALTDLYRSDPFVLWLAQLKNNVAGAIRQAIKKVRPCAITYGAAELQGFSLQRRIPTPSGIVMSDSLQPVSQELLNRQPVDRRVHSIFLRATDGQPVATVVHAICHPVHEMCLPHISPDFPGEMCMALDSSDNNGLSIFLNGAAGDTNPPTVSWGEEYSRKHGLALAGTVQQIFNQAQVIYPEPFAFIHREVELPTRQVEGMPNQKERCLARLNAIRLGSLAILFLPGEPFVETALQIERASPFKQTLVAAFSESSVGYIPTQQAFKEGGYETGPGKWSFLQHGSDLMLRDHAIEMLKDLMRANTVPS